MKELPDNTPDDREPPNRHQDALPGDIRPGVLQVAVFDLRVGLLAQAGEEPHRVLQPAVAGRQVRASVPQRLLAVVVHWSAACRGWAA